MSKKKEKLWFRVFGRLNSLGMANWISDEVFLKLFYKGRTGRKLNLNPPKTFNEKMQWLKINDKNPKYTKMVDKYDAKQFVSSIIGKQYIIPTLGVWDRFEEIPFEKLPKQFVLKCTHDSGGLVICRDKDKLDLEKAKRKINNSLKTNYYISGREWAYKNVKPRIIAEEYMEEANKKGLVDYKFFCFNREPKLLYISQGLENHATAQISFYDLNGKEMPFHRTDYKPFHNAKMPENFDEMKKIARKLAREVEAAFVRIDLYSINGKIYFSEITFSPCNGIIPFEPQRWDEKLGDWLDVEM